MFLCGNFCNSGFEQPAEIMVNIEDLKKIEKIRSESSQQQSRNHQGTIAMIRASNYKKYLTQCKKYNTKFVDKQFPANQKSLNFSIPHREITWKRISEIIPNLIMVENGIDPTDIVQGNIGDSYFLASICALAQTPELVQNIFLKNFEVNGYGLYKVIANVEGVISEVVIDDFVPVFTSTNRPVFCKANGRQIWAMLLEKAWAKIKGSYGQISSGTPHEVLNTFCLAPCFNYQVHESQSNDYKDQIWSELLQTTKFKLPVCAGSRQQVSLNGIQPLHTYTVLTCISIPHNGAYHRIMRMRNPWGQTQYTGFASENDKKFWNEVPKDFKQMILPPPGVNDGDFVIPFTQFIRQFQSIDICHYRNAFSYEFQTLHLTKYEPSFARLEIKQAHQAYITLEKVFSDQQTKNLVKTSGQNGYLRIIIARELSADNYEYFNSKLQTSYGDLSLRCHLQPGNYEIFIQGDYPGHLTKFDVILSYYYQTLENRDNKRISVLKRNGEQKMAFLNSVFKNHALRLSSDITKLSARSNDWIKTTLLYEQGGFGYVACSLQEDTNFKLHINVDNGAIQAEGFTLLTPTNNQFDIFPGTFDIFIFSLDLRSKNCDQLSFPPEGFKISKLM